MTPEDLKKIEEQVKKAQDKLSDLTTAINNEKLNLEKLEKTNQEKTDLSLEIERQIETLSKDKEALSSTFKSMKVKEQVEIGELSLQKSNLISAIKLLEEKKEEIEVQNKDSIKNIQNKITEYLNEAKEENASLKKQSDVLTSNIEILTQEEKKIKDKIVVLNETIQGLDQKIKDNTFEAKRLSNELESIETQLSQKTSTLESVNKDLEASKTESAEIEIMVEAGKEELKDLNKKLTEIKLEIEAQETEKNTFIKAKFALQQEKEDLNNREAFIKEKYELAGIQYS